ncbi:GSCOCG00005013001-RA-CDS [Cotesia congregata]|nr:GSCOCG00005013001-RA-CDS [Cotesia congregata]
MPDESTTQDFYPLVVVEDLQLPRWVSKWKVLVFPTIFNSCAKKRLSKTNQNSLQLMLHNFNRLKSMHRLFLLALLSLNFKQLQALRTTNILKNFFAHTKSDSINLVENGVVGRINFVPAINITYN